LYILKNDHQNHCNKQRDTLVLPAKLIKITCAIAHVQLNILTRNLLYGYPEEYPPHVKLLRMCVWKSGCCYTAVNTRTMEV